MAKRLINTMPVESPQGFRGFNLFLGDVTENDGGLLVVSSHLGDGPPDGRVIDALRKRWGLLLEEFRPFLLSRNIVWTCLPAETTPQPLLLVRMPGRKFLEEHGVKLDEAYRIGIQAVFGSVAALELSGEKFPAVSLPLLAGSRGYDVRRAMEAILEGASQWLRTSQITSRIDFFLFEEALIVEWTDAMNAVLGRQSLSTATHTVAEALRREILVLIDSSPALSRPDVAAALEPLRRSLDANSLCFQQVAAFGRAIMERLVKSLAESSGTRVKGVALEDIESLRKDACVAPWMISHFHSLRIFGNAVLHPAGQVTYRPPTLGDEDLVALLSSIQRVVSFWASVEGR